MKKYEEAQITIISFDQSDDIITTSGNPITTDYDEDTNFGAIASASQG